MKKFLLFILMLFVPFVVYAEELKIEWENIWGGSSRDLFNNMLQTDEGDFIVYGTFVSNDIVGLSNKGSYDIIIIKYDKDGKMLWQNSFGGSGNDQIDKVVLTSDGGIICIGYSKSTDIDGLPNKGSYDIIMVKYDKDGKMLWQNSFGGNNDDRFNGIIPLDDDSFILYGYSYSTDIEGLLNKGKRDVILLKYDKDGNLLWKKSWGGNDEDYLSSFILTDDNEIILHGTFNSTDIDGLSNKGAQDAIMVKFDTDGNVIWQKSWGGNKNDTALDLLQTESGGFIGYATSYSTDFEGLPNKGYSDLLIVNFDKDGNLLWQKSWGGNGYDSFSNILQISTDEFLIYGYSDSTNIDGLPNAGSNDAIILKYDINGNMLWQKKFGGNDNEVILDGLKILDGEFIVIGYSKSTNIDLPNKGSEDAIIIKYDTDGNIIWQKSWGGNDRDYFIHILQTLDGGFVVYGYSYSTNINELPNNGSQDAIIVKYDKDGNMLWQKNWGGNDDDTFNQMFLTSDGGFVVYGFSGSILGPSCDPLLVKFSVEYSLESINSENGIFVLEQNGKFGIVTPTPNEGYEVDKLVIKDKNGDVLDVNVIKLEDGTYSFDLYTDVSVEVLFKEKVVIENPKTGASNIVSVLFTMLLVFVSGLFVIRNYNKNYEI